MRAFISRTRPPEYVDRKNFELGVWVNSKDLSSAWQMKVPRNILAKPYYYNVPGDHPERPHVEDELGKVETLFPPILRKVEAGTPLSDRERDDLAFFVFTLLMRTEQQQEHWQTQAEGIERLYRSVERAHTGREDGAEMVAAELERAVKFFILNRPTTRILSEHGMHFIVNETDVPFITSDTPVIHHWMHIDEADWLHAFSECLDTTISRNVRTHFTLLPLSPRIMLVASTFIRSDHRGAPYLHCSDRNIVYGLNLRTCLDAKKIVISNTDAPFGEKEEDFRLLIRMVREQEATPPPRGTWLRIYTNRDRYLLPVTEVRHETFRLAFKTEDTETLARIAADGALDHLEYWRDDHSGGMMRQIAFEQLDLTGRSPTVIKNSFLPSSYNS